MKKTIRILSLLLCFILSGGLLNISSASDKPKPDMSGSWERDPAESKVTRMSREDLERTKITLSISHKEPEVKIIVKTRENGREDSWSTVYYTDGRGETNIARFAQAITLGHKPSDARANSSETKSKTKWEGSKIVTSSSSDFIFGRQTFHMDSREIRELSDDGKTLTIKYVMYGVKGNTIFKEVFNRLP
jgi:hypothetical protein